MASKPWYTSTDLINAVKRKIHIPISQVTFTDQDILDFANEEMMISQVPDILLYHQEFFVYGQDMPLFNNIVRYPIPERAIGQKLRDVWYKDNNGNLFEMCRINADDQAYFQRETGTNNLIQKLYLEGNEIVLSPLNLSSVTGYLHVTYFLRPNQLTTNDRAAISNSFVKQITIDNTTILPGDTFTIGLTTNLINSVFTAVAGAPVNPGEFQIGGTSVITATNLTVAINTDGNYVADNGSPSVDTINVFFTNIAQAEYPNNITIDLAVNPQMVASNTRPETFFSTSNALGFIISSQLGLQFDSIPDNIANDSLVDFLQTKPGHRTYEFSVPLGSNAISGNVIYFEDGVIPQNFLIGDYICSEYECIIPQIPTDLHNGLAERVCARIQAAQGDQAGLQTSMMKISDIQKKEGTLLDNRVEGSTPKVTSRKSLLAWGRMGIRRRV